MKVKSSDEEQGKSRQAVFSPRSLLSQPVLALPPSKTLAYGTPRPKLLDTLPHMSVAMSEPNSAPSRWQPLPKRGRPLALGALA